MIPDMILPINMAPVILFNTEEKIGPNTDSSVTSLTLSLHTDMNPPTNTGCSSLTIQDFSWLCEFLVHTSLFCCLNYH